MAEVLAFPNAIPDAGARVQALDIRRSFVVEAPAGSGKTGLLIQRYLKLLADESVADPAQILAITFTRKATHEMRDRVLGQLAAASQGNPPEGDFARATRPLAQAALDRDRQLGWELLAHPDRLNISTIDALCARIARSLPVLSGAPAQSPVEDASDLYTQAARRTLAHLGGPDAPLHAALELLLLHRDTNLGDCERLIARMLQWREQWANLIPLAGDELTGETLETVTLPRIEKALEQAIRRALTRVDGLMPSDLAHELAALARRMAAAEGYQGAESPIALCRELHTAPGTAARDLPHWRALAHLALAPSTGTFRKPAGITSKNVKFEIAKPHKLELCELIEALATVPGLREALHAIANLPPSRYPPEQWAVSKALFRVLSRALVELQLVFAERGECDFTEFAILARTGLDQASALDDLTASIGFRLEHLLVDEMQDTSSSQYELIRLLTQHWDGHGQTVFLVGDPKQSIYLFRQARVERFLETLATGRLGDLPLTPLHLTANFRSQAHLVASFNESFAAIFPPSDPGGIHYLPAHATRGPTYGSDLVWHPAPLAGPAPHRAQMLRNAAEIRDIVAQWRARPLPAGRAEPWRIAVLVRNRLHLLEIVRAFTEGGIPYRAIKTEPLAERQEILDLLALTRALLHPADRTAWLALLRGPFCGLTLADLHLLAGADDPEHHEQTVLELLETRGDLLPEDGVERLRPFWAIVTAALAERARRPLAQLVERTWRAFGAAACAGTAETANIHQFFALLDDLESRPEPVTAGRLEHQIAGLYAAPSTAPDAVELMTIHNAKGLEWDVVFVPELESASGKNAASLLDWIEIEDYGDPTVAHGIIAPVQSRGQETQALNRWMRAIDSAREAEERKRLFYVACTRAREELHLFAAPARTAKGELSTRFDSLLRAAWPAAEPIFAQIPVRQLAEETEPAVLDLAAAGLALVPSPEPRTIQRIPLSAISASTHGESLDRRSQTFTRPEGSFEARAAGNTLHAFLELLAQTLALGTLPEIDRWSPRIATALRSAGVPPAQIPQHAASILRALTRAVEDPVGRWILSPHPESSSETAFAGAEGEIRLDRAFLAGPEPLTEGETHLWIVDFKTASHGTAGLEQFLAQEKERYAPQLETYARHLAPRGLPIRLALYYPALAQLLWWPAIA